MAWEDYTITAVIIQHKDVSGLWNFWNCPVSIIVKAHVLETVSVSNLQYKGWEAPTHLGPLEGVISIHWTSVILTVIHSQWQTKVLASDNLMSNFRKSSTSQIWWLSWCAYRSKRTYSLTCHLNAICCANPSIACDKTHFITQQ